MHLILQILALSTLARWAIAAPAMSTLPLFHADIAKGFQNPTYSSSAGGHAICFSGTIDITASANLTDLKINPPTDQIELTNLVLELFQANSTLVERISGETNIISGTFGIYSQLCLPLMFNMSSNPSSTIQFLVHGGGFDHLYWDNALGYSYVDYAAVQGYPTFSYDRLGTGQSEHPDPIHVVQTPMHVAIAHELIKFLRSGAISGPFKFKKVVGVGHSYGSVQLLGLTAAYPKDLDAFVATGASASPDGQPVNVIGQVQTIASLNEPLRFPDLPNGYVLPGSIEGIQWGFFRAPSFDPLLLDLAEMIKQPQGLGEQLLPFDLKPAVDFTGPLYVLNGENDLPACDGNCLLPYNKVAALKDLLFPSASNSSGWYLVPETGHGVNFHYGAKDAYDHILAFLKANRL